MKWVIGRSQHCPVVAKGRESRGMNRGSPVCAPPESDVWWLKKEIEDSRARAGWATGGTIDKIWVSVLWVTPRQWRFF